MIKKTLTYTILILLLLSLSIVVYALNLVNNLGHSRASLEFYSHSVIKQSSDGAFKISSATWSQAMEAQGFVVAGERMFQMELMRRKAEGSLAELFGTAALTYDRQQRKQNWRQYADAAYKFLPDNQRISCDLFAKGVNDFTKFFPEKVSIEYKILRTKPQLWTCVDSLLIALLMTDNMTHGWERDLAVLEWKNKLPEDWFQLLIPTNHPWNKLWFDHSIAKSPTFNTPSAHMPNEPLAADDFKTSSVETSKNTDGSNSWAYRGTNGAWLANDPHLGYQVPQLWIPLRIEFEKIHFVVGTALPGVPGILIGMNEHLAWSITNTGEDIDDALIEDGAMILEETSAEIKIRSHPSEFVTAQRTKHGPVIDRQENGSLIVRHWRALIPGNLGVPAERLARAANWLEFNDAIDEFKFVPLNFTMLDKHSNMGLRISGCDPLSPLETTADDAQTSNSTGIACQTESRRRLFKPFLQDRPTDFISTANEQLWDDGKLHNWADDDRAFRIREVLENAPNLTINDMRLLQLDTKSKFHRILLQYILNNGDAKILTASQSNDWQKWNGDSRDCELCMTEADTASKIFDQIIIKKAAKSFAIANVESLSSFREMKRSRVLKVIENDEILKALGIQKSELANGILSALTRTKKTLPSWSTKNSNIVQHPFVGKIPVLDKMFALNPYPQHGSSAMLRSEKPSHGPSMRLIWNPAKPQESMWAFPIGVSGHPFSKHYKDWLNIWQTGAMSTITN